VIREQVGEATPVGPGRVRRRNPLTRVSAAHLLMLLAAVLAFATNLVVLRNHDETRAVVVAAVNLPAGRLVESTHLRAVEVDVDDAVFSKLIPWTQAAGLVGQVTSHPIGEGVLIGITDFRDASGPAGLRSMSVPIDAEHAVGGELAAGDRIDLILVGDDGPRYVLASAEVLAVSSIGELGALASGDFYIVVAVDAAQALLVAEAIRDGRIEVVRSTGAVPVENLG
jgi:Flp pilus assembly protein CpaB